MVANVFTDDQQSGFSCQFGGREARRQLRMSLGIVVAMTLAIVTAATTFGAHPLAAKRAVVAAAPLSTMHAETNVVGAKPI